MNIRVSVFNCLWNAAPMMALRCVASAFGQQAWIRSSLSISGSAPRLLAFASFIRTRSRFQIRLSSDSSGPSNPKDLYEIPYLEPPWQFSDLLDWERELYLTHGPNYGEHVSSTKREICESRAESRRITAEIFEKDYGPDWYEIKVEAERLVEEREPWEPQMNEFRRRKDLINRRNTMIWKSKKISDLKKNDLLTELRAERKQLATEVKEARWRKRDLLRQLRAELQRSRAVHAEQAASVEQGQAVGEQAMGEQAPREEAPKEAEAAQTLEAAQAREGAPKEEAQVEEAPKSND